MNAVLTPSSLNELSNAVRSASRVLAIGAGTKPRLGEAEAVKISTTKLRGILEYDPGEFTFTALAGTPLREIVHALAESGQHLPFDPVYVETGSTLGGTVASGLSGPGRFRFGGVRDFILGVRFIDGAGRLLRLGGKVVKNAAGFDLPKFFVGSLGRFGVLGEITFKVFPRPAATLTLRLRSDSLESTRRMISEIARSRWDPDALDVPPGSSDLLVRLAGPEVALSLLAREILGSFPGEVSATAAELWKDLREFRWIHSAGVLLKIPLSLNTLVPLKNAVDRLPDSRIHFSAGGQVAYISLPAPEAATPLVTDLIQLGLSGLTLRGAVPVFLGARPRPEIELAMKSALDPTNRFPSLDA